VGTACTPPFVALKPQDGERRRENMRSEGGGITLGGSMGPSNPHLPALVQALSMRCEPTSGGAPVAATGAAATTDGHIWYL